MVLFEYGAFQERCAYLISWDTEYYDKRTVLLVLVFASYTPTISLEKKRQILSFDVLNCISKLPFALCQKVILSTPTLNLEASHSAFWDTECYMLIGYIKKPRLLSADPLFP